MTADRAIRAVISLRYLARESSRAVVSILSEVIWLSQNKLLDVYCNTKRMAVAFVMYQIDR